MKTFFAVFFGILAAVAAIYGIVQYAAWSTQQDQIRAIRRDLELVCPEIITPQVAAIVAHDEGTRTAIQHQLDRLAELEGYQASFGLSNLLTARGCTPAIQPFIPKARRSIRPAIGKK